MMMIHPEMLNVLDIVGAVLFDTHLHCRRGRDITFGVADQGGGTQTNTIEITALPHHSASWLFVHAVKICFMDLGRAYRHVPRAVLLP